MKKIITMLFVASLVFATNFVSGQETSLGKAPDVTFQPWSNPVDHINSRGWMLDGSGQLYKQFLGTVTITPIGAPNTYGFPGAVTYNPTTGKVYAIDQIGSFTMYTLDTVTGVRTALFNCSGISFANLTGITWSVANNTMYGICSSLATSQIFSINMTTGVCTAIGAATATCAGAILVAAPRTGTSLFAVDIVADNLYKFNRTTGAVTLVGALGGNANYGQDGQFDVNDNKLYWASYITAPQLRIIDTTTGSSTVVGTYGITQAAGIAIKAYNPNGLNNYTNDVNVNVYPNPATTTVTVTASNIETIKVSNIAGQILDNVVVNNNTAEINVSNYDAGVYFVQVKTANGFITKKISVTK